MTGGKKPPEMDTETALPKGGHSVHFWGIFAALCIPAFISALDVAIITTALPTITAKIGGAKQYVWIANSFVLASSVLQPLFGQLANIYGRRTPLIASVILFILGSGVGGGATSAGILVAGRTVQGIGAGGSSTCCSILYAVTWSLNASAGNISA